MPALIVMLLWIGSEAWLISRAIEYVGGGWILVWLLAAAIGGVLLIQRQGVRTLAELRAATSRGELPAPVLIEGLVVIMAGLLLMAPGLVSDAVALTLLMFGLRKRLAQRIVAGLAKARPDLKHPVTLEGEYRRCGDSGVTQRRD